MAIDNTDQLEAALSEPTDALVASMKRLDGDLLILGAGGKMGPTFARMARRALDAAGKSSRVIAVSRFGDDALARSLHVDGIDVIAGDLFDADFVRSLPSTENVLYLVGMKFGTASAAARTWASNTYLAGIVSDRFRASRIVALSTGNVYPLVPIDSGRGSTESDATQPVGEYGMSALGRERVFEHFSHEHGTSTAIIRLNYSTELRYGVLVDLAQQVLRGELISLSMGYFNVIWQRDACDLILRTFEHAANPPLVLNVTGNERLSTRTICERFGELFGKPPRFTGSESDTALLSNADAACKLFGPPPTSLDQMIELTANWLRCGGETSNKPTHFEVRDGKF